MTRIVCVSDLHEHLVDLPACDLLLVGRGRLATFHR
jgi:hypothetical protein